MSPLALCLRRRSLSPARLALICASTLSAALALIHTTQAAQTALPPEDSVILNAREAWRNADKPRLAAAKAAAAGHPLAMWVDYWDLNTRLNTASADEIDAFFARWPDTYVEDRLRNDWLLELGRRRNWTQFNQAWPRFRMRDDREAACYALLAQAGATPLPRDAARQAWFDQREADDGCALLGTTLRQRHQLDTADIWRKLRTAVEANRVRQAKQIAALISDDTANAVADILDNPKRAMAKHRRALTLATGNLQGLALIRIAASDPDDAATLMASRWQRMLSHDAASWVWASIGKQTALKLQPQAALHYERAWAALAEKSTDPDAIDTFVNPADFKPDWGDDLLAWQARAALRIAAAADTDRSTAARRWRQLLQALDAMSPAARQDPAWVYWRARALLAQGDTAQHNEARQWLASIASPFSFYGLLAFDELGQPPAWPRAAAVQNTELAQARSTPGLQRGLQLIALGLRSEGQREWNYTLSHHRPGGMNDRELLAAAQLACNSEVWDRCIHASDRTRTEIDLNQRFPLPFRASLSAAAKEAKIDLAYVYGLTRQESRFITAAKSSVGASGLMQVMPATARWTAKKLGIPYDAEHLHDPQTNALIGVGYLKLVLDNFGGAQPLAAAAYNAGPARPRRWREGATLDAAAWVETIPFGETRDYVKRVLANACAYAAVLGTQPTGMRARLGTRVGPSEPLAPPPDATLP